MIGRRATWAPAWPERVQVVIVAQRKPLRDGTRLYSVRQLDGRQEPFTAREDVLEIEYTPLDEGAPDNGDQ